MYWPAMANVGIINHGPDAVKVTMDDGKPTRQLFALHPLLRTPPELGDIHLCSHLESAEEVKGRKSATCGKQNIAFATRSGDLFLIKSKNREVPVVKKIPWYLDPERAVVALTFDPSGSWLLVIGADASLSLVPVCAIISGTSVGVMSRHGWATGDITSFPPLAAHTLHPTCVAWWENAQWGPIAVLGGQRGEILFIDLATGMGVGSTTVMGPVKSLHLCHNNADDSIFLLITNSSREQWKLLLEQRKSGYCWPLDRVEVGGAPGSGGSAWPRGPVLGSRSRLQGLKQLSVEKISIIKQRLAESRKNGSGVGAVPSYGVRSMIARATETAGEEGTSQKRLVSVTPEKLGLHIGETFISPQNSRGRQLLSGYYTPSSLLTVHTMALEEVPIYIHRLPPLCQDILLTDRFIFVTNHTAETLTVVSCQLSESCPEGNSEYSPESIIQSFGFSGGEQVIALFKMTEGGMGLLKDLAVRGGGASPRLQQKPAPSPGASQTVVATASEFSGGGSGTVGSRQHHSTTTCLSSGMQGREVHPPLVALESRDIDTCIVVTTCGVYEVLLRQRPSELFLDLALKNGGELEEAERVAHVFGLNLQHLLEVAGDLELASKSFTKAISFYKLSRCRHLKSVLKFASGGHSVELLGFIETVFGASNTGAGGRDLSPSERIHLSNLAMMAHVERVLRSSAAALPNSPVLPMVAPPETSLGCSVGDGKHLVSKHMKQNHSSTLMGKFLRFLHDNQHYDEVLAVSVVGQTALWEPLKFLCTHRGLHREALGSLSRFLQSVASDGANEGLRRPTPMLTSAAASLLDSGLWECLSDPPLLQPLLEKPELATVHLNFVSSFLTALGAPCLQRLAVLYDPSSPVFHPSLQRMFKEKLSSSQAYKVDSMGINSLDISSAPNHPVADMLEMYVKVLLFLNRKRSGGQPQYFLELMGWSIKSQEEDVTRGDGSAEGTEDGISAHTTPPQVCTLAAGYAHAALVWNRGMLTWGNAAQGCLGHGPTMSRCSIPQEVMSFPSLGIEVQSVSCGRQHTLALTTNGVYAWGSSQFGQIGIGMSSGQAPYPRLIEALSHEQVVQISAGQYHSLALTSDGRVYTWGWGVYGQLGHGDVEDRLVPTSVKALEGMIKVTTVCGGHCHSLALRADGSLMAWGSSVFGQLGHGAMGKSSLPICVSLPEPVSVVATAYFHNLAVGMSNRLYSWGSSPQVLRLQAQAQKKARLKQLCPLSTPKSGTEGKSQALVAKVQPCTMQGSEPSQELLLSGAGGGQPRGLAGIFPGSTEGATVPLLDDAHPEGERGQGVEGESQVHLLPSTVDTSLVLGPITQVSCGCHHSALLTKDGTVYTWGRSLDGQVGNGTRREAPIPAPLTFPPQSTPGGTPPHSTTASSAISPHVSCGTTLPILTRLRASHITCGCEFTLALETTSEKLWAWGSNSLGQLGKNLEDDPRSALHGKVVMLKTTKRVIKWPQGAQNSSDLPYLVPWLPPTVTSKAGGSSPVVKLVVPKGGPSEMPPFGRQTLHEALEFFHSHYSSQCLLTCCLELEEYQAAAKIMVLDRHFHQALAYQLKALYMSSHKGRIQQEDRRRQKGRVRPSLGTRGLEDPSPRDGMGGGCVRCETHSFAIQGGAEEMSEVGPSCEACSSGTEEGEEGEGQHPSAPTPPPLPSEETWAPPGTGEPVAWDSGEEQLARQASAVVEYYTSLLEEDGHQMVRRLLEQGIDFWLAHSLPLGCLETLLIKHMSKFSYPLGLLLFCNGSADLEDQKFQGVTKCSVDSDGGRMASTTILSQLSTRFCLQLCSTLLSHIQHKKVACPEYVELLAQVMAMQVPFTKDNGDNSQVPSPQQVPLISPTAPDTPEHLMEAVLENLTLLGMPVPPIHVPCGAVPFSGLLTEQGETRGSTMEAGLGPSGPLQPEAAVVFSCGHHFQADRFRQNVLPETELALLGLHHPLPHTAHLVRGLFSSPTATFAAKTSPVLQLACPNCVLNHLQAQV